MTISPELFFKLFGFRITSSKPTGRENLATKVTYKKLFRGNLPSNNSPDSSGSPLLCIRKHKCSGYSG